MAGAARSPDLAQFGGRRSSFEQLGTDSARQKEAKKGRNEECVAE